MVGGISNPTSVDRLCANSVEANESTPRDISGVFVSAYVPNVIHAIDQTTALASKIRMIYDAC